MKRREFFALAHELQAQGEEFATAHVVRAEKPTSARPGDRAIVTRDGVLHGWIGGSCAQPTVVEVALEALADGRSRLVRLSPEPEAEPPSGFEARPMTCFSGGTLDVYIEPQSPQPRLIVVGDQPVARALAQLGATLGYRVLAVTSPEGSAALEHADEARSDLEAISEWATDWSSIVVATHGHFDEPALALALSSPARYVGLVASRKRAASVRDWLRSQGLENPDRLRAPAGLDLGAVRGDEIALSILAEIVKVRREAIAAGEPTRAPAEETSPPEPLRDPVCGMAVTVREGTPQREHGGQTYAFCCPGCANRFEADPFHFLDSAPTG